MPWPPSSSFQITNISLIPVAGTNGTSWTATINGFITLSTGQTLLITRTGVVPGGIANAISNIVTNGLAGDGVPVTFP